MTQPKRRCQHLKYLGAAIFQFLNQRNSFINFSDPKTPVHRRSYTIRNNQSRMIRNPSLLWMPIAVLAALGAGLDSAQRLQE